MKIQATRLADIIGTDSAPLVKVRAWKDFNNKGRVLGTVYEVLDLDDGCGKLAVKVPGEAIIAQEDLNAHNRLCDFVYASFSGLQAREYSVDGKRGITATAEQITIVKGEKS